MAVNIAESNFKLRSSTDNDPYGSFEITAGTTYTSGQMLLYNDTVCVVVETKTSGYQVVFVYWAAKIIVPCVEITTGNLADFDEGSKVYFDAADAEVNASSGSNTLCGIVLVQPSVGDETVEIHLDGMLGIVA